MIKNLRQITDNKKIKVKQIAEQLGVSRQAVEEVLARDIKDLKVGTLRKYLDVVNGDLKRKLDALFCK